MFVLILKTFSFKNVFNYYFHISLLFSLFFSCCFRCGVDKVKFNTPASLKCQASVACVEMHNICTEAVFDQMAKNSNPVILDFLLSLSV